jgi:hypothetical protein
MGVLVRGEDEQENTGAELKVYSCSSGARDY